MAKAAGSTLLPASRPNGRHDMPESVYDVILLIDSSKESGEKAAANAGHLYAAIVVAMDV